MHGVLEHPGGCVRGEAAEVRAGGAVSPVAGPGEGEGVLQHPGPAAAAGEAVQRPSARPGVGPAGGESAGRPDGVPGGGAGGAQCPDRAEDRRVDGGDCPTPGQPGPGGAAADPGHPGDPGPGLPAAERGPGAVCPAGGVLQESGGAAPGRALPP